MTKKTVAVMEDDPGLRRVITDLLKNEGFDVVSSETGRDMIELIRKIAPRKPDLFLMDVMLPDFRGYNVVLGLREAGIFDGVPVLVVSGKEEK